LGKADKTLPPAILPYPCAWLRDHATAADAIYFLKFIVKAESLDTDTLRAVLIWLNTWSEDAKLLYCPELLASLRNKGL